MHALCVHCSKTRLKLCEMPRVGSWYSPADSQGFPTSMDEIPGARPVAIPVAAVLIEGIDVVHPAERLIGARACLQAP